MSVHFNNQRDVYSAAQQMMGRMQTNAQQTTAQTVTGQTGASAGSSDPVQDLFKQQFADLAQDPEGFHAMMKQVYGESYDAGTAEKLRQASLRGDFSWLPEVKYVSSEALGGANGAYSADEGVVYLNEDLSPEKAAQTFVEEAGHHLDTLLNTTDTVGDEGEMFRRLMAGENLSASQVADIRAENDKGTITIDGKEIEVEFWNPFKAIGDAVSDAVDAVGDAVSSVVDGVKGAVSTVVDGVKSVAGGIWNGVKAVGGAVWDGVKAVGGGVINAAMGVGGWLMDGISGAASGLWDGVKAIGGPILDGIKAVGGPIIDGISAIAAPIVDTVKDIGSDLFNAVKSVGGGVLGAAKLFGEGVLGGLFNAGKALLSGDLEGAAQALIDGADKAFLRAPQRLGNGLIDATENVFLAGTNLLGPAEGFARDVVQRGADVFRTGFNTVTDVARDTFRLATELPVQTIAGLGKAGLAALRGDFSGALDHLKQTGFNLIDRPIGHVVDVAMRGAQGLVDMFGVATFLQEPSRPLTADERAALQRIYGDSIDLDSVRVSTDDLSMKAGLAPHTVGNTMHMPAGYDPADGLSDGELQLLVHEAGHVWQNQNSGGDYIHKSLYHQAMASLSGGSRNGAYEWEDGFDAGLAFSDLNPEQQAHLIEDIEKARQDDGAVAVDDFDSPEHFAYAMAAWNQVQAGQAAA